MVQRKRHLAKAVTYRILGSAGTAGIAYIMTDNLTVGASVGVVDAIAKIGVYYVHERVWYRIKWGVEPPTSRPGFGTPEVRRTDTHTAIPFRSHETLQ